MFLIPSHPIHPTSVPFPSLHREVHRDFLVDDNDEEEEEVEDEEDEDSDARHGGRDDHHARTTSRPSRQGKVSYKESSVSEETDAEYAEGLQEADREVGTMEKDDTNTIEKILKKRIARTSGTIWSCLVNMCWIILNVVCLKLLEASSWTNQVKESLRLVSQLGHSTL